MRRPTGRAFPWGLTARTSRPGRSPTLLLIGAFVLGACTSSPAYLPAPPTTAAGKEPVTTTLAEGSCYNGPAGESNVEMVSSASAPAAGLTLVACTSPHRYEAYATAPSFPSDDYPGADSVIYLAHRLCAGSFVTFVGQDYQDSRLAYSVVVPDESAWSLGRRSAACLVFDPSTATVAGSLRGAELASEGPRARSTSVPAGGDPGSGLVVARGDRWTTVSNPSKGFELVIPSSWTLEGELDLLTPPLDFAAHETSSGDIGIQMDGPLSAASLRDSMEQVATFMRANGERNVVVSYPDLGFDATGLITSTYDLPSDSGGGTLVGRQYTIVAGGIDYEVTFRTSPRDAVRGFPVFDQALASLRISRPSGSSSLTSHRFGYTLTYPATWLVHERPGDKTALAFQDLLGSEVDVAVDALPSATIGAYARADAQQLTSAMHATITSQDDVTLGGRAVQRIAYTFSRGDAQLAGEDIMFKTGDRIVTCIGSWPASKAQAGQNALEGIASSLTFAPGE
jgi:hypothetical protein